VSERKPFTLQIDPIDCGILASAIRLARLARRSAAALGIVGAGDSTPAVDAREERLLQLFDAGELNGEGN
jgi:hypothetical protein